MSPSSLPITAPTPAPPAEDSPLLADFLDPSLTLSDLARKHNLSAEALTRRITADHALQADLAAFSHLNSLRTRLLAASQLPRALLALSSVLNHYTASAPLTPPGRGRPESGLPSSSSPAPSSSSSQSTSNPSSSPSQHPTSDIPTQQSRRADLHPTFLIRLAETARKSASAIIQLSRYQEPTLNFAPSSAALRAAHSSSPATQDHSPRPPARDSLATPPQSPLTPFPPHTPHTSYSPPSPTTSPAPTAAPPLAPAIPNNPAALPKKPAQRPIPARLSPPPRHHHRLTALILAHNLSTSPLSTQESRRSDPLPTATRDSS